jgi:flagellar basal body-associated protein FliL
MPEEKQNAQPQPAASKEQAAEAPKKKNKMVIIIGIVAAVLIMEGAGFFVAVKLFSHGPAEAVGVEIPNPAEQHAEKPLDETAELKIAVLECPHTNTGRFYIINMTVFAAVPKNLLETHDAEKGGHGEGEKKDAGPSGIEAEISARLATIKDRMRTVVASADPSTLCLARSDKPDYGLSTLRRQFKSILDEVLGKGKVKDVLISDYMPTPVD